MGKIVIPKHSADMSEINAVFEIYYSADDWVTGATCRKKLMSMIGDAQYPSSYPKKAQVPLYFGFLKAKSLATGADRKITASGKAMYEAIKSNDIAEEQRLLMEAMENMTFGRNNPGAPSSKSDIEAPCLLIRTILELGSCTAEEFAYMVWELADNGKKFYSTVNFIRHSRSSNGLSLSSHAKNYKDSKPIIAMERWNFLKKEKSNNGYIIDEDVLRTYYDRLNKLAVYNVDKCQKINVSRLENIQGADTKALKPLVISESESKLFQKGNGSITMLRDELRNQNIYKGDKVVLTNSEFTRLFEYRSFAVSAISTYADKCDLTLSRDLILVKEREQELLKELKSENQSDNVKKRIRLINEIIDEKNVRIHKDEVIGNVDIEPVYLFLRMVNDFNLPTLDLYRYVLGEMLGGNCNYTDLCEIYNSSKEKKMYSNKTVSIPSTVREMLDVELVITDNDVLKFNPGIPDDVISLFGTLKIYLVDIR